MAIAPTTDAKIRRKRGILSFVNPADAKRSKPFTVAASAVPKELACYPLPSLREASISKAFGKSRRSGLTACTHVLAQKEATSAPEQSANKKAAADCISCRFIMSRNSFCVRGGCFSPL